jgi:hypothetical protein
MKKTWWRIALVLTVVGAAAGWTHLRNESTGLEMTEAARAYLATLSAEQKSTSLMSFDTPQRVAWHFIPKAHRKGLQIKHMDQRQRKAAFDLLRSVLSEVGYDKARKIMALEGVLRELEKDRRGGSIRDPERYYYTVFGEPSREGCWGLSIEGHHLSLNFVIRDGKVVSSTPTFFAANPTIVCHDVPGTPARGTRVLAEEELLGFNLVQTLDAAQRERAVIAETAPREIRAAGEPQPPAYVPEGLGFADMKPQQQEILRALIAVYAGNLPEDLAGERLAAIEQAGFDKVYFAWAGADRPGIGHYYRIQGPTFLIEFVNTQPDAAGNPASHIHCVWRDPRGDFALSAARNV